MAPLSQKEKENKKTAQAKICPHCDKPYEFSHMTDHLFRLRGNSIMCHYCIKEGYIVTPKGGTYKLIFLAALLLAFVISFGAAIAVTAATYNPYDGTVRIFWWLWILAFILTGVITRFITRIAKWKMATISNNKRDKDYGEIR